MSDNTSYPEDQYMNDSTTSYVRILHAVPDAPEVDIYANDNLVMDDLSFGEYTDYFMVPVGTYQIAVYPAGTKETPVAFNELTVEEDAIVTIAAVGNLSNVELLMVTDVDTEIDPKKAMVRFLHLSPNAPAVDITLPDGTVVFNNVSYREITTYTDVEPMTYTLQVRVAGTPTVVLTVPDLSLEEGEVYTIYAIGLAGDTPELEALLLLDGE